jgi:hypothetical protein
MKYEYRVLRKLMNCIGVLTALLSVPGKSWAQGSQVPTGFADPPAMAICRGGGLQVWGSNDYGELGIGTTGGSVTTPQTNPYLHNVAAVDWSGDHAAAILHDGSVWTWGRNDFGQLGINSLTNRSTPQRVPDLDCARAISLGSDFTLVLLDNGSVWGWGNNSSGQLGISNTGSTTYYTTPRQIIAGGIGSISAGYQFALALATNNTLYSWGHDFDGELGINAPGALQFSPAVVTLPTGAGAIAEIHADLEHSVALSTTGQVYTWGQNNFGELGNGTTTSSYVPVAISTTQPVVQVATTALSTLCMLNNGATYFWGSNNAGQRGICGGSLIYLSPTAGPSFPVGTVIRGLIWKGFCAISPTGSVTTWGENGLSQLGYPAAASSCTPASPVGICAAIPDQAPQSGCCGVSHTYFQNSGASYVAANYYPGSAPYEIGNYNTLTTINGNGNTIVFDGVYHVKGPVAFEDARIELRPGTVFYVEPRTKWQANGSCYPHLGYDEYNSRLFVGERCALYMENATLRSLCDELWAGVQLVSDGELHTDDGSVIRDAYIGVMGGEYCHKAGAASHYFLRKTEFLNCRFGVVDLEKSNVKSGEGITYCTFDSNPATMLAPFAGQYTRTGLVLDGSNLQGLLVEHNTFDRLVRGVEAGGYQTRIAENDFTRCYDAAVSVAGEFLYKDYSRRVTVAGNTITVPDDYFSSAQIAQGNPVTGVRAFGLGNLYTSSLSYFFIEGNKITGANPNPTATAKPQIGVEIYAYGGGAVRQQNTLQALDEGVRLQDAGVRPMVPEVLVADNHISQSTYGVELRGDLFNHVTPAVECNTLDNTGLAGSVGVHIDLNTTISDLGNSSYPVGNKYLGFGTLNKVVNDQSNIPFTYWQYSNEGVSGIGNIPGAVQTSMLNPATQGCGSAYRGSYANGVNRSTAVSTATVADWMQRLRGKQGTARELLELGDLLIDYHHRSSLQAALLAFVGTLPGQNDTAYYRLSFYLLDHYRRTRQGVPTAQVRTALRRVGAADAHVQARLDLGVVLDSVALRRRAYLSPADSNMLRRVAATPTGAAAVADAVLRHFYPQLPGRPTRYPQPVPRQAAAVPATGTLQLYPNPAASTVRVSYQPINKSDAAQLVLRDLRTGRAVHTAALPAGQTTAEVDVRSFSPGLYACQLLVAGRLVDVQRLYVVQ